jgi:hypothetical protein
MDIYNKIFQLVNNQFINKTKYTVFVSYFQPEYYNLFLYNNLNYLDKIKFRYKILKNYLFHHTLSNNDKHEIITMFYNVNKILFPLYKFKHLVKKKILKFKGEQIDLNFNILHENNINNILIIDNTTKSLFNIFDLIKIICSSLSYEEGFFINPKIIKNPWNNIQFSYLNLFKIFCFIKNSHIEMPILFLRFFQSDFCLKRFEEENKFIITQYIINNWRNLDSKIIDEYIMDIIHTYNISTPRYNNIIIDKLYSKEYLRNIFDSYIKIYLLSNFSYEYDIRIKNKLKLKKTLLTFKKQQPLFGRRFVTKYIKQIYCISQLKYKHNEIFITDAYIPKDNMIFLENKCILIEFDERYNNNNYTLFPSIKNIKHNFIEYNFDITKLNTFANNYIFNIRQQNIIDTEYKKILENIKYTNFILRSNTQHMYRINNIINHVLGHDNNDNNDDYRYESVDDDDDDNDNDNHDDDDNDNDDDDNYSTTSTTSTI